MFTEQIYFSFKKIVPAKVIDLVLANDGSLDTLKVRWKRPPGNFDFYNITLFGLGSIKERKTLQPHMTEAYFDKLIPGHRYQVDVNTISGELFTKKTAYGRTGKHFSIKAF